MDKKGDQQIGIGAFTELLKKISPNDPIDYYVLCGKNEQIYKQLQNENHPRLIPLPYISSRQEPIEITFLNL